MLLIQHSTTRIIIPSLNSGLLGSGDGFVGGQVVVEGVAHVRGSMGEEPAADRGELRVCK